MAQPYDYTINVPNPVAGFLQGMQIGGALKQQRQQQEKAAKIQNMMQTLRTNPSPENFAALYAEAPELAKPLQIWQQTLDAPKKNAVLGVLRNVKPLLDSGKTDLALQELDKSIQAFENTPGYESQAATLKETKRLYEMNPDAGKMRVNSALYNLAPEEYEKVWKLDPTSFQRDLASGGIDPNSPEGQQLQQSYILNRADPIVQMQTPTGKMFVGPRSEYTRRYGGVPTQGSELPLVTTPEQLQALPSGAKFIAPDGKEWTKK